MKAISLLITSVFLFSLGTGISAQETELPDPGLTPDSPFYFLEIIAEEISAFFTFGDLKKAEMYATLATERIAEAKDMAEKEKPKFVEKALKRYEKQLNESMVRAEKAMNKGKDFEKVMEAIAKAGKAISVHLEVLAEVYEKVPEQAKPTIEQAMAVSIKEHEKAVKALKGNNTLGEVPEEAPISTKIPQEARERIQRKAQVESMIEKAFQVSESSRDLCIKLGGPQEMCEKIPIRGFKSLEAIKTFCLETGGPPEQCASFEPMCREVGVTIPDECFIVLMTSTVEVHYPTELKDSPEPSSPEE